MRQWPQTYDYSYLTDCTNLFDSHIHIIQIALDLFIITVIITNNYYN